MAIAETTIFAPRRNTEETTPKPGAIATFCLDLSVKTRWSPHGIGVNFTGKSEDGTAG